ncbi:hypothetical protein TH53_16335 [Pedobacter lusitanus]|uniref:DUF7336 domain-containing protein n=1 Tax=Pedobacter lusitanus TaxID=1503925 RepID=A0A0D0GNS4_9SPHI|nr:hypothetical protein [Pedobacter lusitanus]KIO76181.1 hypothetical protein TH53_16335 [Pedobacter lusitanus]
MEFVYLLWHTHSDGALLYNEDGKLIGVYNSKENAEEAQSRAEQLNGFKDHREGFEISRNEVDKDEWTSGFVSFT